MYLDYLGYLGTLLLLLLLSLLITKYAVPMVAKGPSTTKLLTSSSKSEVLDMSEAGQTGTDDIWTYGKGGPGPTVLLLGGALMCTYCVCITVCTVW